MKKTYLLVLLILIVSLNVVATSEYIYSVMAQPPEANYIWQVGWSPVADKFAVMYIVGTPANNDDIVAIYDSQTLDQIGVIPNIPHSGIISIREFAWNQDGTRLAVTKIGSNPWVEIWDISTVPFQLVTEYQADVYGNEVNVSWKSVNEISMNTGLDVRVIDATDGSLLYTLEDTLAPPGKLFSVNDMYWSYDGRYLLVGDAPGILWDTQLGIQYYIEVNDHVYPIAWSPDSPQFVAYHNDVYHIWDATTLQQIGTLEGAFDYAEEVHWENGVIAALVVESETDIYIQFWNTQTLTMSSELSVADYDYSFDLSPDSKKIIYGGADGIFHILDVPVPCHTQVAAGDTIELTNAINAANNAGDTTIICLAEDSTYNLTGELPEITGDIIITGNGATLAASPTVQHRHFTVTGSLTLDGVTLSGGDLNTDGGAILNNGTLTINDSTINDNHTHGDASGGAIYNTGTLTISNTTFAGNSTDRNADFGPILLLGYGGAIYNTGSGTVAIDGGVFNNNESEAGGAIYNHGMVTLTDSTLDGNLVSSSGGGIYSAQNTAQVTINNTQIINNSSRQAAGGGIVNTADSTMQISGSTLSGNEGHVYVVFPRPNYNKPAGGAVANYATLTITDSVITGNTSPHLRGGAVYSYTEGDTIVHNSCISGNSDTAVYNASMSILGTMDFTNNWWGAADGPSGGGPGSGDSIAGLVVYSPFITTGCPH